ncbi:MAG: MBL fold metallo-hydrolase [Gammaproteobacteria bacterium]|nr:MBL fold metallo-hydrolase [Gammaproteobacteria bacterium]
MSKGQWVCKVCGYNMIGEMPEVCPFCGARHDTFIDWEEAERTYRVTPNPVNDYVTQLMSVPRLGYEHAAYRILTDDCALWVDCPSAFNRDLEPVQEIYFTHPDFMGASNLYREQWSTKVHLHALDADGPLVKQFPIDDRFEGDFVAHGVEAYHIGGHTPGFTIYIYNDVLFTCDYAFPPGPNMHLNPYSPMDEIRARASRIIELISGRALTTVCGYNYVADFRQWIGDFRHAVKDERSGR